ncbi:MAG: hypothetical protein JXA57_15595 [Armatimonadetes bacterium]|nr:hypothetical protein [Armatimonadota bacterium]
MSTMKSQQARWQLPTQELPISSKQQPCSLTRVSPAGIEAGFAAIVLAALSFSLVLAFAAATAANIRAGYEELELRQDIEGLRAETALLRYHIHLAESSGRIPQAATELGLRPGDPVEEVDYVLLPHSVTEDQRHLAQVDPIEKRGLAAALAEVAAGVVGSAEGRAEASVIHSRRQ